MSQPEELLHPQHRTGPQAEDLKEERVRGRQEALAVARSPWMEGLQMVAAQRVVVEPSVKVASKL